MDTMGDIDLDEAMEVKLKTTRRELNDVKGYLSMQMALEAFVPQDDPVQMLAVKVLSEAGIIKVRFKPTPKKRKAKAGV